MIDIKAYARQFHSSRGVPRVSTEELKKVVHTVNIGSSQPIPCEEKVVHKPKPVSSRHGQYKDQEARRKWRREYMAKKREKE